MFSFKNSNILKQGKIITTNAYNRLKSEYFEFIGNVIIHQGGVMKKYSIHLYNNLDDAKLHKDSFADFFIKETSPTFAVKQATEEYDQYDENNIAENGKTIYATAFEEENSKFLGIFEVHGEVVANYTASFITH